MAGYFLTTSAGSELSWPGAIVVVASLMFLAFVFWVSAR